MAETTQPTPIDDIAHYAPTFSETLQLDGDTVEKLAQLGARATGIEIVAIEQTIDDGLPTRFPVAIIHGDEPELQSVKKLAEEYRTHPAFRLGIATVLTLDSFIALVNRQKEADSAVFCDSNWRKPSMTAVIDYHASDDSRAGAIGNGQHRVHYTFPLSEEWQDWLKLDGQKMTQLDFAQMIEDRIGDLAAPDAAMVARVERDFMTTVANPAQMLTLSRGLEIAVEARVKDQRKLQSGEASIHFEETHKDSAGEVVKVPGIFMLRIAPFFMGEPVEIPVRLRYRVAGGSITWTYHLYRPDQAITEAVRAAIQDVEADTELPVFEGAPEMNALGQPINAVKV